jgi:hypothetical protein
MNRRARMNCQPFAEEGQKKEGIMIKVVLQNYSMLFPYGKSHDMKELNNGGAFFSL